jgi:hypothetical protein
VAPGNREFGPLDGNGREKKGLSGRELELEGKTGESGKAKLVGGGGFVGEEKPGVEGRVIPDLKSRTEERG